MSAASRLDLQLLFEVMLRIRRFEEAVVSLVNANEIPGITHEYIGQEAVAAGVLAHLDQRDRITSTHRGHGHAIARGLTLESMFAELMGKDTGPNRGRGGSMHVADSSVGHLGANGIVGASAPIACGAAFSLKKQVNGGIVVTFFGDGGINQGVLLESLNLAVVWALPVLFVCENNGYAVSTPIDQVVGRPIVERAEAFGLATRQCDGMNVAEVFEASGELVDEMRDSSKPAFLQCDTYRFSGHHTAEALQGLTYRDELEIEEWKKRDPLCLAESLMDPGQRESLVSEIESRVHGEIEAAIAAARSAPEPARNTARTFMYHSGAEVEAGK